MKAKQAFLKQRFMDSLKERTATAISTPYRAYQGMRGDTFDRERGVLKQAKAYDTAPDLDSKGNITDAFKIRSMADNIRQRRMGK